jgi:hypothetical protein
MTRAHLAATAATAAAAAATAHVAVAAPEVAEGGVVACERRVEKTTLVSTRKRGAMAFQRARTAVAAPAAAATSAIVAAAVAAAPVTLVQLSAALAGALAAALARLLQRDRLRRGAEPSQRMRRPTESPEQPLLGRYMRRCRAPADAQ